MPIKDNVTVLHNCLYLFWLGAASNHDKFIRLE